MKEVILTVFEKGAPMYILNDGSVMEPVYTPNGTGWDIGWEVSKTFTAKVSAGISGGGEAGYNVTLLKGGKVVGQYSTAA